MGALFLGWYNGDQKSGTSTPGGAFGNAVGTYNLNGGLLTGGGAVGFGTGGIEVIGVAGTGIFNQNAGTNDCSTVLMSVEPTCRASPCLQTMHPRESIPSAMGY